MVVDPAGWRHGPGLGDSISVNGCCLTVALEPRAAGPGGDRLVFDAIPETLSKTSLGELKPGSKVHLEHAVTASTLLGGHVVQGHVDGVGVVMQVQTTEGWRIRVRPPLPLGHQLSSHESGVAATSARGEGEASHDCMEFLTPKGSVCIQGVSLTIAALDPAERWFEVALIPTTLEKTMLGALVAGDRVNLEFDVLAKTIVHWLRHYRGK